MKLSNEYINKQHLVNMLVCVHPEDRNWEEAISIIEDCGAMEAYPVNWIDTGFLNYNLDNICEKPYVIALPIRIGDTVFVSSSLSDVLRDDDNNLRKGKVVSINLNKYSVTFSVDFNEEETKIGLSIRIYFSLDEIGKDVFLKNYRG